MGAYKIDQIEQDFQTVTKGFIRYNIELCNISKRILEEVPDNKGRDFAISHLIQAAEMLSNAYILNKDMQGHTARVAQKGFKEK